MIDNALVIDSELLAIIADCANEGYDCSRVMILSDGKYYVKFTDLCVLADAFNHCGYGSWADWLYEIEDLNCHE